MSIKNEDRHGMSSLKHERVKAFDKLHIPPGIAYMLVGFPIVMFFASKYINEEEELSDLRERNTLLAMRKTQIKRDQGEDEDAVEVDK